MKPLCAFCVRREAYALHEVDGRDRYVCRECADDPVPDPDESGGSARALALRAIQRSPGVTFTELRERLEVPGGGSHNGYVAGIDIDARRRSNALCKAVERLAKAGVVERRGMWPNWTYWPATERRSA